MQKGLFGASYTPVAKRKPGRPPSRPVIPVSPTAVAAIVSPTAAAPIVSPPAEAASSSIDPTVSTAAAAEPVVSPAASSASKMPPVKKKSKQAIKRKWAKRASLQERMNKLEGQVMSLMEGQAKLMAELSKLRGEDQAPPECPDLEHKQEKEQLSEDPPGQEEERQEEEQVSEGRKEGTHAYFQACGAKGDVSGSEASNSGCPMVQRRVSTCRSHR